MASGISFSLGTSTFSGTVRLFLMSSSVASIRIAFPNRAYCPQTTRSALLKSATRLIVAGSRTVEDEIRRSPKIWCTMLGLTVRRLADWPTSVVSMSATLEPIQSSDGSEVAFRKGRIASDAAGAGAEPLLPARLKSLARNTNPQITRIRVAAIGRNHRPSRTPTAKIEPDSRCTAADGSPVLPVIEIRNHLRNRLVPVVADRARDTC